MILLVSSLSSDAVQVQETVRWQMRGPHFTWNEDHPAANPPRIHIPTHSLYCAATRQRRARALLAAKGLLVEEVDGADSACVERRAELWALSGLKGTYPQFFLEVPPFDLGLVHACMTTACVCLCMCVYVRDALSGWKMRESARLSNITLWSVSLSV